MTRQQHRADSALNNQPSAYRAPSWQQPSPNETRKRRTYVLALAAQRSTLTGRLLSLFTA